MKVANRVFQFSSFSKALTIGVIAFAVFIIWIIYLANSGGESIFFRLVAAFPYGDKLGHFMLFGILVFGVNLATRFHLFPIRIVRFRIYSGTLWVSLFVTLEELSQGFFSTRTMDWTDLIADACGILFFTWLTSRVASSKRIQSSWLNSSARCDRNA